MNDAMGQRWVVLVHGYGANRADPTAGLLGLARDIRDRNYGLLMFDMRSSGESAGKRNSAGFYERFDLLGALDYLTERGASRDRIGVLGHSMGAAVALMACTTPDTAAAVVADSSFADLWLMIKRAQKGVGRALTVVNPGMSAASRLLFGVHISDISPAKSLALSESPVLIIHGGEDSVVPPDHAMLLAKAAGSNFVELENASDKLWIVPGAGHLEAYRVAKDEYVEKVASFFDRHLSAGTRAGVARLD
jgi:dipeptidyl aminopeptidase/acylaminoacyl peptidase